MRALVFFSRSMIRLALASLLLMLFAASSARTEEAKALRGVALVIGQSDYDTLPDLPNPGNDARAIGKLLTDLGFDVVPVTDADTQKLRRALDRFSEDAAEADVALVYYSGHGIEAAGENYLVPVDGDLQDPGQALVPLSGILAELQQSAKIAIVLLDACRSNPFPPGARIRTASAPQGVAIGAQGLGVVRGVTSAEDGPVNESLGQVLGFAAEPGEPALDGVAGGNSPYAAALLKHLAANRGYDFGQVMTLVAEEVYLSTQARQRPWTNGSLRRFLNFGLNPEETQGDEALIRDTRRKLLVTIAATPQDLRRTVEMLAAEKKVPLAGMYDVLRALGQSDFPKDPEKIDRLLSEQAEKIATMMAERRALDAADPEITRLAMLADRAIDEGALPAARTFLDQAKTRIEHGRATVETQRGRLKAKDAADAALMARSAETFVRDFDHLAAAGDFAKAFSYVRESDAAMAFAYKSSEADALSNHGDYKGDNDALKRSMDAYREAQLLAPRERLPLDWAAAQNKLGNAFLILGSRESGTEKLEQAVAAYRQALEERTRERVPFQWAMTQNNLGSALFRLGERENGTAKLQEAVVAFLAALEERTRLLAPLDWATTQANLGNALLRLGERESGKGKLEEAVVAFRGSLQERTRERVPLQWAATQTSLGNALVRLGERESGTAKLEEAVAAYREALKEWTRGRVPLDWAMTQNNLGNALSRIGERENGTVMLEEAVAAYREVLQEWTRERVPLDWATTQTNLGNALWMLGERESGTAKLEEAVAAFRLSLKELTRERAPVQWATAQNNLGGALGSLGGRESGTARLEEAVVAYREALQERSRERLPLDWATTQHGLGLTLRILGERRRDRRLLQSGREAIAGAWEEYKRSGYDYDKYFQERIAQFDAALAQLK